LSEENRLRALQKRDLKRIYQLKRQDVTLDWRKLHMEKLRNLYASSDIIRVTKPMRVIWAG
jgi:hypothetical protein